MMPFKFLNKIVAFYIAIMYPEVASVAGGGADLYP